MGILGAPHETEFKARYGLYVKILNPVFCFVAPQTP